MMRKLFPSALVILVTVILIPNAFAQDAEIPSWIKNNAGWWATDQIPDSAFLQGIQYLIKEGIMVIPYTDASESASSQDVPSWIKNNAGWWADGQIDDSTFVSGIQWLVANGIIVVESNMNPELIAEMWVNGHVNDEEFLRNVDHLIEKEIITIQSAKSSQLPDWLVNNAGWWAARIFTNSDFDYDPGYVKEEIYPCTSLSIPKQDATRCRVFLRTLDAITDWQHEMARLHGEFNSHGWRGDEFQEQKHDVDFRIFAVGGSTTYGEGVTDDETWPAYLQQIINEKITGKKIEVINAGVNGIYASAEYDMIKNQVSSLDPDLIIMYDGWNDGQIPIEKTIQSWESVCKLGKNKGFDTIITIQPVAITGQRVQTEQEITYSPIYAMGLYPYTQRSQQYVDAFEELDEVCTKTADLRRIFDYIQEPIFYDAGHVIGFGNKIIAENIFSIISPIYFEKTYSITYNNLNYGNNESGTHVVYAVGSDLSNRNFDNLNLQNAVFDKADLSNTSFKNANIDDARFAFANLNNSNLFDREDLSNINLAGANLSYVDFEGKDLSGSILIGTDLSDVKLAGADLSFADLSYANLSENDLTGTKLAGASLRHANLEGANLKNADFTSADFSTADLGGTNLKDAKLDDAKFVNAKFKGIDISLGSLPEINLVGADLSEAILTNADLSDKDLSSGNLSGQNLSGNDLTNTILTGTNMTDAILPDGALSGKNLTHTKFNGVDLSGKDLSQSILQFTRFDNANLKNVNLIDSESVQVDFTKIKNKSLAGAKLLGTSFSHSNLSGVDLSGATLFTNNFHSATLSGVDFTVVSNASVYGSMFGGAVLPNANFEGVNFVNLEIYKSYVEDGAYLAGKSNLELSIGLFSAFPNIMIVGQQVAGDDLMVEYFMFNNFVESNLQNANFSNANLQYTSFLNADLTNANLSNANLSNATLVGAILDGANLNCLNHPVCVG